MRVLLFLLLILLFPAICAFAYESGAFLLANASRYLASWFTYGLLFYLLIYILFPRRDGRSRFIDFMEAFEHELGHATAVFMSFRSPVSFSVDVRPEVIEETGQRGVVQAEEGCFSQPFISLAPYWLPLFTIPFLVARFLISPSTYDGILDFLIGFTLAFHYVGLLREFSERQTDITNTGLAVSLFATLILNAISLVVISCIVFDDHAGIGVYFQDSLARSKDAYQAALLFLRRSWLSD